MVFIYILFYCRNLKDLDPKNPLRTMSLVVDIAHKQLGIYSVIGISEMVNCSTQNEVEMAAYLFQFYEMFHHEPIPQAGPMQHAYMNVNMNMDTIETPDTERVFIDYHIDKDYNRGRGGFIGFSATVNNISVISSILLVEETRVHGENHRLATNKGNNKITEHRAIFQRERRNSY